MFAQEVPHVREGWSGGHTHHPSVARRRLVRAARVSGEKRAYEF